MNASKVTYDTTSLNETQSIVGRGSLPSERAAGWNRWCVPNTESSGSSTPSSVPSRNSSRTCAVLGRPYLYTPPIRAQVDALFMSRQGQQQGGAGRQGGWASPARRCGQTEARKTERRAGCKGRGGGKVGGGRSRQWWPRGGRAGEKREPVVCDVG